MRRNAVIRRLLRTLERRFRLDDGIFLATNEITNLLRGDRFASLIAICGHRHRLMLKIDIPAVIFSDELESVGRATPINAAFSFQGTPLFTGWADGPALVLNDPAKEPIESGYVLNRLSTDLAWVPFFVRLKALVMETGGMISHGAIVAREFGLPAVARIPGIQRRIQTGQIVRVDGQTGLMTVFEEPRIE